MGSYSPNRGEHEKWLSCHHLVNPYITSMFPFWGGPDSLKKLSHYLKIIFSKAAEREMIPGQTNEKPVGFPRWFNVSFSFAIVGSTSAFQPVDFGLGLNSLTGKPQSRVTDSQPKRNRRFAGVRTNWVYSEEKKNATKNQWQKFTPNFLEGSPLQLANKQSFSVEQTSIFSWKQICTENKQTWPWKNNHSEDVHSRKFLT